MQFLNFLLAEIPSETIKQISEIHERIATQPAWTFKVIWTLTLIITVAVIVIFLRQKKIAQNQVDLAKLISQLFEK